MPVIDVHAHAFPDSLAPRAIAALEAEIDHKWRAFGNGTVTALIESMDAAGIDLGVVCPIATKPDQVKSIFKWCKKISNDRIIPFPSVHPDTPKVEKWLQRFAEARLPGIKLHPMYQQFWADEERMDPIYSAATDCDLAVEIHSGFDIAYGDDDNASVERLARVMSRHPRMKLVLTHLGAWREWDNVRKHLVGSGVYMETSFSLDWLGPEGVEEIIRDHGPEHVLFGTDWPWARQDKEVDMLNALGLSEKEKDAILWSNAARLLGF